MALKWISCLLNTLRDEAAFKRLWMCGWYVSNVSIIFDCSMLIYYPFWMFMGFTLHFYIIFGTNLLTGGPTRIVFFAYFNVSKKRNIKRSPNGMKPSGAIFLDQMRTWRLGVEVKQQARRPWGCPARPPTRCATCLVGPSGVHRPTSSSYIYPCTPKTSEATTKTISTALTFCIREIPSWSLRRHFAGGGIDHGGPLHHLQGLSDEFWVVYHRPSGP